MKRGINLRQQFFWLKDAVSGKPINKVLANTQRLLDNPKDNKKAIEGSLKELLNHAVSTTQFYKKHNVQDGLDGFSIINKNIIRDNFDDFISSKYNISKCRKVSTSGSTGSPFSVYHNKEKLQKNIADNIYFSSKSNYNLGDHLIYVKIWSDSFSLKKRVEFQLKNMQPLSVFNLSDDEIKAFIEKLNRQTSEVCFIGYASSFEKICKYLDTLNENPIAFKTKSIITISEALNDYTRNLVKKYFGIQPMSRYSNNENGIIAQQTVTDDLRFKINESSYIVEIFDLNSNKKLGYGERGRIVVTDLHNLATPLIRYDTGDVGVMELDENNKPFFSEISGRVLDLLYDTKGNLVPSHISAKLCKYGNYKQFQLVQKGLKEYEINLNTDEKVDEIQLIEEYKSYFGEDAIVKINYVDDIPLLNSGKRREVVNEYYNAK
ncbi:CoF synthetase [Winogradskyella sp.]|jgi:phenylacetate-CoA ligase|uniref:CoF synthetase n=1 Tax=Winogradskyella sp. TaxID=1883156 RepID=UPI0025F8B6F7|nr:CoF synthetase [Winogradskyella sp.]MCT4629748.1 CoF synthetase [Winogradskyella sp.]